MVGKRGGTSEDNRSRKLRGHEIEKVFALRLGLREEYLNDKTAKKDVIDPSGDMPIPLKNGVKSGKYFCIADHGLRTTTHFKL